MRRLALIIALAVLAIVGALPTALRALTPGQQVVLFSGCGVPSWLCQVKSIVGAAPSNYADYTTTGTTNHFYVNGQTQATPEAWWAARAALPGGSGGVFSRATLETGVAPGSLLLNTFANNVAAYVADPSSGKLLGRQYMGGRTNLHLQSQFASGYSIGSGTLTANAATAPDGTTTAASFIPAAANTQHYLFETAGVSQVNTATYSYSVFVKPNGYTNLQLDGNNLGTNFAQFQLTGAGSVLSTTGCSATVSLWSSGWYYISITFTASSSASVNPIIYTTGNGSARTYNANGTSGYYFWQMDFEAGAFASPTIYTTSSTVARAADSQTLTRAAPTSITKVIAGRTGQNSAAQPVFWDLSDGTNSNDINLFWSVSGHLILQTKASGTTRNTDLGVVVAPNTDFVLAFSVGANGTTASLNGAATVNTASATFPAASMTSELEGQWQGGAETLFSTIARTAEWTNYAASNSALQALSLRMANP